MLTMIRVESCEDRDGCWARVWTAREEDGLRISDISWEMARRLVPVLLRRNGVGDVVTGIFAGEAVFVTKKET